MVEASDSLVEHYREQLRAFFSGRKTILIGGPVAGLTARARELRRLGAERPFIIGSSLGTGELPTEEDAEWVSLELSASGINEAIRSYENHLTHLPEEVRQRVDAYDPKRSAISLGAIILGDVPQVGGRPRYGARPRSWSALEDKVAIEAFWDSIGVARSPSLVVRPALDALLDAARYFDKGRGTVWAGDSREGVHGGAEGVRWVQNEEQARAAADFFATRCDRVRVMPFLEGIPCSIHGMVLPDGVAVFRPLEMITLRRVQSSCFLYAGAATYWDPPSADREAMRELARTTARALGERVGFRGSFTVDGVLTEEGFRPTELNPRIGAGLALLEASVPGLPLVLLGLAAQAGQNLDYRPEELEELVTTHADARRAGGGWTVIPEHFAETRELPLTENAGVYRLAAEGEAKHGTLTLGPSDVGGFVRFTPAPGHAPIGSSLAPRVASAFAFLERELGVGFGPLAVAKPAR